MIGNGNESADCFEMTSRMVANGAANIHIPTNTPNDPTRCVNGEGNAVVAVAVPFHCVPRRLQLRAAVFTQLAGFHPVVLTAVQHHVAFSSLVSGAGVVAGGPFFCAQAKLPIAQR